MRLSRRHLLGNLAALPVTAHASSEPITIVCPNVSDIAALDVLNAKAGGHFAAQGLDVTLVGSGNSAVAALQQLVAGRCHFLRAPAIELMKAVTRQQVPLLSIGCPEHAVTYVMLSAPDRPIRTPAMLQSKRVGVIAVGSATDNYLDLMLHHAGLPHDTVERQVVGSTQGRSH